MSPEFVSYAVIVVASTVAMFKVHYASPCMLVTVTIRARVQDDQNLVTNQTTFERVN